jgi:Flp pilus assembly pilin Flp
MKGAFEFARDERGQDLLEYSLLITFIAIACIALIASGRPATNQVWQTANAEITAANSFAFGN